MTPGRWLISTWVIVLVAGSAAPAAAVNTPPGNSAGNQYVETLPGAGGDKAVTRGSARGLPPRVRRVLAAAGRAGLVVLGLGAQAPGRTGRGASKTGAAPRDRLRPLRLGKRPVQGQSVTPAIAGLLIDTGPAGPGWALPAALFAITLVALVLARRSRSPTDSRP